MNKNKILDLSEYGILPNTNEDYTGRINEIISANDDGVTFRFAPGTYRFFASNAIKAEYSMSNSDPAPQRNLSLLFKNHKNIVLDGNRAKFIFYGHLQPITLDNCENINLCNFSIDWEKPLVAEGVIVYKTTDYLEVSINQHLFPCFVRNFCLYFDIGNGEVSELTYGGHTLYDATTLTVSRNSADKIMIKNAEHIADDRFRLYITGMLKEDAPPYIGDIIVLRHNQRKHAGIFAEHCTNLIYQNITIHSCGGIGILSQFCENITCRDLRLIPNRKIGRIISCTRDDGIQISNCRGQVDVEGCSFHGLQDSPIDIHGTSVCVRKLLDEKTVECEYMHLGARNFRYWAEPGHIISFISRRNMAAIAEAKVTSYRLTGEGRFILTLEEPLPENLQNVTRKALAIENLTNTPQVTVRFNHFGSCRSRGILVTTHKPVLIEDNLFESAGSAILIAGDASFWYESGACRNVIIRRNSFTDACNLSAYEYCYAMISICPQIPQPGKGNPYHSNIVIEDNVFSSPDTPVLYAFSVDSLMFKGNRIFHSERVPGGYTGKSLFLLKSCRNARLEENVIIGTFSLNERKLENSSLISNHNESGKSI